MGIKEEKTPVHWNYFIALEDDVVRMSRYLEPTTANFPSYSMELARILFAAASEVDVVAKCLCKKLNDKSKADRITAYKGEITTAFPNLPDTVVEIPRFGLTLTPWILWKGDASPLWWRAYNNVKHHRDTHFSDASLHHALNAVAGLFVLLLFFYEQEAKGGLLSPNPAIFRVGAPFAVDRSMFGSDTNIYQLLPAT